MGTDKVRILDRRGFSGDVYTMIDDIVAYILSKINIEYIIEHVKREERPELPEEALREAVVNALAHRDYRSTANVQVYIFKDRVEIVSPGGLPAGMTEADLGVKSIPRNPLLFSMLYRMEAVEQIGSGIKRIRNHCREYGVDEPVIDVSENWFTITFKRPVTIGEIKESEELPELGTASVPSLSQVCPKSLPVEIAEKILRATTSPVDIVSMMNLAGHTNRTRFRKKILQPLMDAKLIEHTIPDKPRSSKQRYRITEKGNELLKHGDGK
jgi:ATP-dependent DNA helicase RecG